VAGWIVQIPIREWNSLYNRCIAYFYFHALYFAVLGVKRQRTSANKLTLKLIVEMSSPLLSTR
jgi:hypothetical protein